MSLGQRQSRWQLQVSIGSFNFCCGFAGIITFILVLVTLLSLGRWQLDRAHEKEGLLEQSKAVFNQNPVNNVSLGSPVRAYQPLAVNGHFIEPYVFLLDNAIRDGVAGYEVLKVFSVDSMLLLVNIGWMPGAARRDRLPVVPDLQGKWALEGYAYYPSEQAFVLREDDYTSPSWPMLIEKIDMKKTSSLFSAPLLPFVMRLSPSGPGGLRRDWSVVAYGPERNYGYALQWFALAAAWSILFVRANTQRRSAVSRS